MSLCRGRTPIPQSRSCHRWKDVTSCQTPSCGAKILESALTGKMVSLKMSGLEDILREQGTGLSRLLSGQSPWFSVEPQAPGGSQGSRTSMCSDGLPLRVGAGSMSVLGLQAGPQGFQPNPTSGLLAPGGPPVLHAPE